VKAIVSVQALAESGSCLFEHSFEIDQAFLTDTTYQHESVGMVGILNAIAQYLDVRTEYFVQECIEKLRPAEDAAHPTTCVCEPDSPCKLHADSVFVRELRGKLQRQQAEVERLTRHAEKLLAKLAKVREQGVWRNVGEHDMVECKLCGDSADNESPYDRTDNRYGLKHKDGCVMAALRDIDKLLTSVAPSQVAPVAPSESQAQPQPVTTSQDEACAEEVVQWLYGDRLHPVNQAHSIKQVAAIIYKHFMVGKPAAPAAVETAVPAREWLKSKVEIVGGSDNPEDRIVRVLFTDDDGTQDYYIAEWWQTNESGHAEVNAKFERDEFIKCAAQLLEQYHAAHVSAADKATIHDLRCQLDTACANWNLALDERESAEATIQKLTEERTALRNIANRSISTIAFMASVVKCGERWSINCQEFLEQMHKDRDLLSGASDEVGDEATELQRERQRVTALCEGLKKIVDTIVDCQPEQMGSVLDKVFELADSLLAEVNKNG
jgi:hypothetical protein